MNKIDIVSYNIAIILASIISVILMGLFSLAFPFLLNQAKAILIWFTLPLTCFTITLISYENRRNKK